MNDDAYSMTFFGPTLQVNFREIESHVSAYLPSLSPLHRRGQERQPVGNPGAAAGDGPQPGEAGQEGPDAAPQGRPVLFDGEHPGDAPGPCHERRHRLRG